MSEKNQGSNEKSNVVNARSGTSIEMMTLAYPLVVSFLSFSLMGLVDTFIIGRIGTAEQGGVGMGQSLTWTILCVFTGTMTGVTTFVAQSFGAGKHDELNRWVVSALALVPVMSLILWLFVPFLDNLVALFGTTPEVRPHVLPYMTIRILGGPFIMMNFALSSFLRGLGDTKTPAIVTVIVNVFNVLLDVILIFGYGPIPMMGVRGAALASVLSTAIAAMLYLRVYLGRNNAKRFGTRSWPGVRFDYIKRFLKVGFPIGAAWMIESISWAAMTIYIASIEPAGLAAHAIVWQLIHFSFMPAAAFSVAASTLVGQYLGAERADLAKKSALVSMFWGTGFMAMVGICFYLLRFELIGWFNSDPGVVLLGSKMLLIAALFQVFDACGITTSGVLRGAGDTRYPLYVQVGAAWFVFIPLIFILGKVFDYGVIGAWIAALVFVVLLGILMIGRFIGGKWQNMRVV